MSSATASSGAILLFAAGGLLAACGGSVALATPQGDASAEAAATLDASQEAPGESDASCSPLAPAVAADAGADVDPCYVTTWFGPPASPCPGASSCLVAWSQDGGVASILSIEATTGIVRAPLAVTGTYVVTWLDVFGAGASVQSQLLEVPLDGGKPVVLESQASPWSFTVTVADDGFIYYASGAAAVTETGEAIPSAFALKRAPSGALSGAPTVLATATLVPDLNLVVDSGHLYVGGPLGVMRVPTAGGAPEPIVTTPVADRWGVTQKIAVAGDSLFYVTSDGGAAASVVRTDVEGAAPGVALAAAGSSDDPYVLAAAGCPSLFVSGPSVQRFAADGTRLGTVVPPIVRASDPLIVFQAMALAGTHLYVEQECRYTDPGPVQNVRDVDLTTGQSVLLSDEPGWPFLPGNLLAPHDPGGTRFYFAE